MSGHDLNCTDGTASYEIERQLRSGQLTDDAGMRLAADVISRLRWERDQMRLALGNVAQEGSSWPSEMKAWAKQELRRVNDHTPRVTVPSITV
jgi:hypothetical protein